MKTRRFARVAAMGLLLGAGACSTPAPEGDSAAEPTTEARVEAVPVDTGLGFLREREVYLPQFAGADDGSLYIVWREPAEDRGGNLFMSRRQDSGVFTPPARINDIPDSVGGGSLDEGREAIATGEPGVVGVAWTDRESTIRLAISHDGGATFAPSLALNSDAGTRAYRGFVDMDIDASGAAHAAWIDGRFAPRGAEEPAELYYATVAGGEVTEINLTEDQMDSICGCCRIAVDVRADDTLVIAFRNTGGGYRDIFRTEAGADRVFSEPERLGPPTWELNGCPVMGPLNVGDQTFWVEASAGKRRMHVAAETGGEDHVVAEDTDEWAIERPPRRVVGSAVDAPLILVPGRPTGAMFRRDGQAGGEWRAVAADIPRWAMSAAVIDGSIVFIGGLDGELNAETRRIDF